MAILIPDTHAGPSVAEPSVPQRASTRAWAALIILTAAYAVAFLDRVILSLMVDPIRQDLQVSDAQIGLLQGFAFSLIYSVLGVPLGLAVDRYNRVRILIGGMVVWSIANMACGLAVNFNELFMARAFVGVGEAALAPVAASLITAYFPPAQRGTAFGVYVAGNSMGAIIALMLGGQLLALSAHLIDMFPALLGGYSPWHVVFFITGLPGLMIAAIVPLIIKEPPRIVEVPRVAPGMNGAAAGRRVPYALLTCLMLAGVLVASCAYAMISWFPTLLMRTHDLSVQRTGVLFGMTSMGMGLISSLISGAVIAWLIRRGRPDAPVLTGIAAGAGYILFGIFACLTGDVGLALTASALASLLSNWITPSVLTALTRVTAAGHVGRVVAIYTMLTGLLSMTIGSALPGLLADTLFPTPTGIGQALAVVYGGSAVLAIVLFLVARPLFIAELKRSEPA
ncbi:MFS transporter [Niveispirillum fermenti]|uniref:MFS transporter n=1 Tax=Niveispirillum fermenti TaxID=1233113 RepID=UPI003A8B3957